MPLISSTTIITSISLFHITLAYFFLTNPSTIDDQVLVWVLGESMGMPLAEGSFDAQSPALALLAVVLGFVGFTDLVSLSMPEEIGLIYYWSSQAPLRTSLSMVVLFYSFLFGPSSPAYQSTARGASHFSHPPSHNPAYTPATWGGDALKNRVAFTFLFVEMISWFWAWVTLREERNALVDKLQRKSSRGEI